MTSDFSKIHYSNHGVRQRNGENLVLSDWRCKSFSTFSKSRLPGICQNFEFACKNARYPSRVLWIDKEKYKFVLWY